jgi:hypothetical protein
VNECLDAELKRICIPLSAELKSGRTYALEYWKSTAFEGLLPMKIFAIVKYGYYADNYDGYAGAMSDLIALVRSHIATTATLHVVADQIKFHRKLSITEKLLQKAL